MVFRRHGCVAKSSTKVTTLPSSFAKATADKPVSRLALTPKSSFSPARLPFNGPLAANIAGGPELVALVDYAVSRVGGQLRMLLKQEDEVSDPWLLVSIGSRKLAVTWTPLSAPPDSAARASSLDVSAGGPCSRIP